MNTKTMKEYQRPFMVVEQFTPNEYVAGCQVDGYNMYKVASENVGVSPDGTHMQGNVYYETNGISGLQTGGSNPDQSAGGGMSTGGGTASSDGYVYFDMNDAREGYVINGTNSDGDQWWRVIIFHPLTYGSWDNQWHAYNQNAFVPADSSYVINANNAS